MDVVNDFLEHYGKKGMRWGKRKTKPQSSDDHKSVSEIRKKKTHQLSNKELREHNDRINLETKFNQVNPSKVAKGSAKVKALLAAGTTAVAVYNMINSPAGKAFMAAGKKRVGTKSGARAPAGFEKLLRP